MTGLPRPIHAHTKSTYNDNDDKHDDNDNEDKDNRQKKTTTPPSRLGRRTQTAMNNKGKEQSA